MDIPSHASCRDYYEDPFSHILRHQVGRSANGSWAWLGFTVLGLRVGILVAHLYRLGVLGLGPWEGVLTGSTVRVCSEGL